MIPMTSIVTTCEAEAERRSAASEQAHEGAAPPRSAHDARKKGDDDFEEGEATIGGTGKQRYCSTS